MLHTFIVTYVTTWHNYWPWRLRYNPEQLLALTLTLQPGTTIDLSVYVTTLNNYWPWRYSADTNSCQCDLQVLDHRI